MQLKTYCKVNSTKNHPAFLSVSKDDLWYVELGVY